MLPRAGGLGFLSRFVSPVYRMSRRYTSERLVYAKFRPFLIFASYFYQKKKKEIIIFTVSNYDFRTKAVQDGGIMYGFLSRQYRARGGSKLYRDGFKLRACAGTRVRGYAQLLESESAPRHGSTLRYIPRRKLAVSSFSAR